MAKILGILGDACRVTGEVLRRLAYSKTNFFVRELQWFSGLSLTVAVTKFTMQPFGGPEMTQQQLVRGNHAPDFALQDKDGVEISLRDYRGQKVIAYFYPAASTPGCTTQACDFQDNLGHFQEEGYVVLGISKDKREALEKFAHEERLNFPLLSDSDLSVHHAYGAYGEKSMYGKTVMGVIRSTFVIDQEGLVEHALYNVKATGHVAMLRKKLGLFE